jgi:hypothetical protein
MAWEDTLADRLDDLPRVICGPLLRRVGPKSVTVWLALRKPTEVKLTIHDTDGDGFNDAAHVLMSATKEAYKIGDNLYLLAITARSTDDVLVPGKLYFYNLGFQHGGTQWTFAYATTKTSKNPYVYEPLKLPSFSLPPKNLGDVRIIQGSCRKPCGEEEDMLAYLDSMIEATANDPVARPHQLLLTGDQIYADEPGDATLTVVNDVGQALLVWDEAIPDPKIAGSLLHNFLGGGTRWGVITDAGFTSGDRRSHLMGLGEYLAMYLLAWSDVLWPTTLPTAAEMIAEVQENFVKAELMKKADAIDAQTKRIDAYRSTLPKVRRALANIPSYMSFDDHEITDDWAMTEEFCAQVLSNKCGQRVMQNGLVAFALCQMWGNTPEQFEYTSAAFKSAGAKLLELLGAADSVDYTNNADKIFRIVGLLDHATLKKTKPYKLRHNGGPQTLVHGVSVNEDALDYHFRIESDAYVLAMTDCRTLRRFPRSGGVTPPDQISPGEMVLQCPYVGDKLLVFVVGTNMPPIPGIREAERLLSFSDSQVYENDLFDSWRFPSPIYDQMIRNISEQFAADSSGVHKGRCVIFSGDVHSSFASRIAYWSTEGFNQGGNAVKAEVVFAQFVASALRNEAEKTRGQHDDGYDYSPHWYTSIAVPDPDPVGVIGWNHGTDTKIGRITIVMTEPQTGAVAVSQADFDVGPDNPSYSTWGLKDVDLTKMPHYRYRLDQVWADAGGQHPRTPPAIDPLPSGATAADRRKAAKAYKKAAGAYLDYADTSGGGRAIVGHNNLGEVTFTWTSTEKVAHFTVRWKRKKKIEWARYTVPFDPNDANYLYKDVKHRDEP